MLNANFLLAITPLPMLSVMVWIILGVAVMYLARRPFHQTMDNLGRLIYNAMRLTAASVKIGRQRLEMRNREVLLAAGIGRADRRAQREFERITARVERSLSAHPQLHRQIRENLLKLEDDYQQTTEIPEGLSDWVKVIDAIAGIKPVGDPMVATILEDIHNTLKEQHRLALENHRKAMSARHGILSAMMPQWHKVEKHLKRLEASISGLTDRADAVDRSMAEVESLRSHTDTSERQLLCSSLTQFLSSGLVVGIFLIGIVINFNLVAFPMAEMVGAHSHIGEFKTSHVAALFLVSLQVVLGLFLMDTLKITHFFSAFDGLSDRQRTGLLWCLLVTLTILAGVESSLAVMRDRIAMDMEALRQSLAGIKPTAAATSNISTIGQMILGFMLPYVLATMAIPLESFVRSLRTVVGVAAVWALYGLTVLLRLAGSLGYHGGRLAVGLFDLIIFPAIWLEALVQRKLETVRAGSKTVARLFTEHQPVPKMAKETVACKKASD